MKKILPLALLSTLCYFGCSGDSENSHAAAENTQEPERAVVPVDYSKGRAMNARLGKGINLGNSWDSRGNNLDCSWGNCIEDEDFKLVKAAGFNSIRLPVRWQQNSDYSTHTVDPERLAGVKEDIALAISEGLAVIVNFHHYEELNKAGSNYSKDPAAYNEEKTHFLKLWEQVAKEMNEFPDDMLVLEILNEPTISSGELVDELLNDAYEVIRENAPGKTIMFESYHAAKFQDLGILHLPADGNIIYSGHYYEPFAYSHQGHSAQNPCVGDAAYGNAAMADLMSYVKLAKSMYPDVVAGQYIPMNMGEFGISGGTDAANTSNCKENGVLPTATGKAKWAQASVQAAEALGISWHYWGLTRVGGFEAYDRASDAWYEGFPEAFGL